jgi:hypothetical protein
MRASLASVVCVGLTACTTVDITYVPPVPNASAASNVKVVDRPRDAVWNSSIPQLGKQSVVINSLDKASGVVSISYTGDLARYIDCGHVTSTLTPSLSSRTDDFAYSNAQQFYFIKGADLWGSPILVNQRMSLEAHANLVFEEMSPTRTRVSANTLYTVRRQQIIQLTLPSTNTDTISFNSGGGAPFPASGDGLASACVATGALEGELLSVIQ